MARRRCSKTRKGKYLCDKCDRAYSSSQSLYYHCYQKHRNFNNNNNIEIDGDIVNNEPLTEDELEAVGPWPINVKLHELYKFENYEIKPINEIKPEPINEVKPEPINQVKPEPINQVKPEPINQVKPEPINEFKQETINEVKPEPIKEFKPKSKPVNEFKEEQNSILKDTLDLINKCISNNIDINLKIKINNKTIEIKSD